MLLYSHSEKGHELNETTALLCAEPIPTRVKPCTQKRNLKFGNATSDKQTSLTRGDFTTRLSTACSAHEKPGHPRFTPWGTPGVSREVKATTSSGRAGPPVCRSCTTRKLRSCMQASWLSGSHRVTSPGFLFLTAQVSRMTKGHGSSSGPSPLGKLPEHGE